MVMFGRVLSVYLEAGAESRTQPAADVQFIEAENYLGHASPMLWSALDHGKVIVGGFASLFSD